MVKRDDQFFIPRGNTELQVGDKNFGVITDNEKRWKKKRSFRWKKQTKPKMKFCTYPDFFG